ncbi:hypothetical protein [Thioalkalivibrio sp. HK1]|nr:hypothetical protein [Thioalkalivibrio sp. HK1]
MKHDHITGIEGVSISRVNVLIVECVDGLEKSLFSLDFPVSERVLRC